MNSRAYCSWFNFRGSDQQKPVGQLSGGERNRVHLAKLLKSGGNLLLLDEPTNDLDVDTLRALEEALLDFPGCAVVISHDRWFLDRIATHILAFEGDSQAVWFEGTYEEYEADRKQRLGDRRRISRTGSATSRSSASSRQGLEQGLPRGRRRCGPRNPRGRVDRRLACRRRSSVRCAGYAYPVLPRDPCERRSPTPPGGRADVASLRYPSCHGSSASSPP